MIDIWLKGFAIDGKLKPYDAKMHANLFDYFNNSQVEYCIRKERKKPSTNTHGYYRGVLIPFLLKDEQFKGWNEIRLHRYFAVLLLKDIQEEHVKGKVFLVEYILSTAEITQERMNQFITELRILLSEEFLIETPEPEKQ